jgi:hypothetical protein
MISPLLELACYSALALCLAVAPSEDPKLSYQKALRLYNKGHLKSALPLFQRSFALLDAQIPKQRGQAQSLLRIGQADILYHLAQIAQRQKKPLLACKKTHELQKILQRLPKGWRRWPINPQIFRRFRKHKDIHQACQSTPSFVFLRGKPKHAAFYLYSPQGWEKTTAKIPVKNTQTLRLRIEADHFLPQELTLTPQRWKHTRLAYHLQPAPPSPRRLIASNPPPKRRDLVAAITNPQPTPTNPQKRGLPTAAWIAIGVFGGLVVIGGITAAVLLSRPPPVDAFPAGSRIW